MCCWHCCPFAEAWIMCEAEITSSSQSFQITDLSLLSPQRLSCLNLGDSSQNSTVRTLFLLHFRLSHIFSPDRVVDATPGLLWPRWHTRHQPRGDGLGAPPVAPAPRSARDTALCRTSALADACPTAQTEPALPTGKWELDGEAVLLAFFLGVDISVSGVEILCTFVF